MKRNTSPLILGLALALAVAAPRFITGSMAFASPSWSATGLSAAAQWLSTGAVNPTPGGQQNLGGPPLPTSVFAHNDPVCSVQGPQNPVACSVTPSSDRRCTAYCDEGMVCSALTLPNSPDIAFCSVIGRPRGLCSVLQPARQQVGPSRCSAFNDSPFVDQLNCSVIAAGGPKQACSAENPSQFQNECSAFRTQGPVSHCSVINGGTQFRNFCSVGRAGGQKTCSTYGDVATCSVAPSNFSICTSLLNAPSGSCSVQVGNGHCSVFGGASGDPCVQ